MEQKIPLSRTLPLYVRDAIQRELDQRGKALPGIVQAVNGPIVTINFQISGVDLPVVAMPLFGPEYIRYPVQVGDKGVCFPVDVYIGAMSGLGTGEADLTQRGNLSTLVFFPIGNKNWSAVDSQAVTIYGPNGVVLRDSNSDTTFTLTPSGITVNGQTTLSYNVGSSNVTVNSSEISMSAGGHTLVINSSGISLDGLVFLLHTHSGVTTGSGVSGPVVP